MKFFKSIKILGKRTLYENGNNSFKPRDVITIIKPKDFNNTVIQNLLHIGCEIVKIGWFFVTLILPFDWWASKIHTSIVNIMDQKGRIRITISKKKTIFIRRYSFCILEDEESNDPFNKYKCFITDYTSPVNEIIFDRDFEVNALLDAKGDLTKLQEIYSTACMSTLDKNYPAWRNEKMYWD